MAINKNNYLDGDGNYDLKKALVDEVIDGLDSRSRHYNLDYSGDRAGLINSLIDLFNASEIGEHGYSGAWAGNYYIGGNIYKTNNGIGTITMTPATGDASSKLYNAGVGWNEVISSAIVESGSNPNGRYIKFSDGTMICTVSKFLDLTGFAWTAYGSIYSGYVNGPPFPATFLEAPVTSKQVVFAGGVYLWSGPAGADATTTHWEPMRLYSSINTTPTLVKIAMVAIGRWK